MLKKNYIPTTTSRMTCIFLIGLLVFMYIFENFTIRNLISIQVFDYYLKPIVWFVIAWLVWRLPYLRPKSKLNHRGSLVGWAFIFALIFIAASFLLGIFIDSLGKSPYSHSIKGIGLNIFMLSSALIGRELIRNYLVNSMAKEEKFLIFTSISFLMTLSAAPFSKVTSLTGFEDTVKYFAQYIAPDFSHNLLATYLAFLGGVIPSIIYFGVIQAIQWLSPILPNLQWLTAALVGVMCPVFSLTVMQGIHLKETKQFKMKDKDEEGALSWIVTSLLSITIVWFSVGVFPVYPSVIATGSMEPMIMPGDVILVKKIASIEDLNNLRIGEVIQFKRDSILISHRIIEIIQDEKTKEIKYKTKGDNNSGIDGQLVSQEDVKGRIVYVVPKIGWPTLLIKSKQEIPLEKVVF